MSNSSCWTATRRGFPVDRRTIGGGRLGGDRRRVTYSLARPRDAFVGDFLQRFDCRIFGGFITFDLGLPRHFGGCRHHFGGRGRAGNWRLGAVLAEATLGTGAA